MYAYDLILNWNTSLFAVKSVQITDKSDQKKSRCFKTIKLIRKDKISKDSVFFR